LIERQQPKPSPNGALPDTADQQSLTSKPEAEAATKLRERADDRDGMTWRYETANPAARNARMSRPRRHRCTETVSVSVSPWSSTRVANPEFSSLTSDLV
jgi:hypothetical protein